MGIRPWEANVLPGQVSEYFNLFGKEQPRIRAKPGLNYHFLPPTICKGPIAIPQRLPILPGKECNLLCFILWRV